MVGSENEFVITVYREQNISIENMSITVGNRYFKTGTPTHVIILNVNVIVIETIHIM
jgi:hypothetical protein